MKKLLFTVFTILSFSAFSQKEVYLTGYSGLSQNNYRTTMGGLGYDIFINDNWQLNYSIKFGSSNEHGFTMHTTAGILGGGWIFLESIDNGGDYGALAILACFIPEGVTCNFFLDNNTMISPYLNPLTMEYNRDYFGMIYDSGVKFKKYIADDYFFSCNIGVKSLYTEFNPTMYVGGSFGFVLYD